jgi:uridylate kinase
MTKKIKVLSLGGSLIVPNEINISFLKKFKEVILKNTKFYKFIIVCGGGKTARNYISALGSLTSKKEDFQSQIGIESTKLNAKFLAYFFNKKSYLKIPKDMKEIKNILRFNDIVFCGALRYSKKETSDSTSAKLANYFQTDFINLTNVEGLYDKDPNKNKNPIFIPEITHKRFLKRAKEIKYIPGQHFVLDQKAAKIIKKNNIITYILGPDLSNLQAVLQNKAFIGTRIS